MAQAAPPMAGPAGIDWVDHWHKLVSARVDQAQRLRAKSGATAEATEQQNAQTFGEVQSRAAKVPDFMVPILRELLEGNKTLIDVGAGPGRHSIQLAPHARSVLSVEPSGPMRGVLERNIAASGASNVKVISDRWEDAKVEPADVVFAANVAIEIEQIEPFIKKMDDSARERCVLVIRDAQEVEGFGRIQPGMALWYHLWQKSWDEPPAVDPSAADLFNVLWQLGIRTDIKWFNVTSQAWANLDQPVDWVASQLYLPIDTPLRSEIRGLMDDIFKPHPNGVGWIRKTAPRTAVMSWAPLSAQKNG